jgi:hypothetical protein
MYQLEASRVMLTLHVVFCLKLPIVIAVVVACALITCGHCPHSMLIALSGGHVCLISGIGAATCTNDNEDVHKAFRSNDDVKALLLEANHALCLLVARPGRPTHDSCVQHRCSATVDA